MKKYIIILMVISSLFGIQAAFSQTKNTLDKISDVFDESSKKFNTKEKVSWAIRVGIGVNSYLGKIENAPGVGGLTGEAIQSTLTPRIAFTVYVPMTEKIYFQSTLLSLSGTGRVYGASASQHQILFIPLPSFMFAYRKPTTNKWKWELGTGISSSTISRSAFTSFDIYRTGQKKREEGELSWSGTTIGLVGSAGLYCNKFYMGLQGDLGINNILHKRDFLSKSSSLRPVRIYFMTGFNF